MHEGSRGESAVPALERVAREFDITPACDATTWAIAADRVEELGDPQTAAMMRENPCYIHYNSIVSGPGDGSGSGSGDGSGDGSEYGSGSGDGSGYGYGYGYG